MFQKLEILPFKYFPSSQTPVLLTALQNTKPWFRQRSTSALSMYTPIPVYTSYFDTRMFRADVGYNEWRKIVLIMRGEKKQEFKTSAETQYASTVKSLSARAAQRHNFILNTDNLTQGS